MNLVYSTPEKTVIRMQANPALINAIRRSVHEIKTLAIDDVEFFKNDSALYDEILAHRIGLIPLVTDKKTSDSTEVELKLSKKGPCTVYSGDLKGGTAVVHSTIPLVILKEDQELEFVGTARMATGVDHAKHVPGLCYHRHLYVVKSKDSKVESLVQEAKGLIAPEKHKDGWLCDLPEGVVEQISRIDSDAIVESEEVLMIIESYGAMPSADILTRAGHALEMNLDEFEKALK